MSFTNYSPHFNEEQLLDVLAQSKDATGIYTGKQYYIQFANEKLIKLFNKGPEIIGQPLPDAVPELNGQPYMRLLEKVWNTGAAVNADSVSLCVDGMLAPSVFHLNLFPILNTQGTPFCVMVTAVEAGEETEERTVAIAREQKTDALNKRLTGDVNSLMISNTHLKDGWDRLSASMQMLEKNCSRFRQMIESSPVAVLIFRGENFVFEEINPAMLRIIGKDVSIKGKPLLSVMPELKGQDILQIMQNAYQTGVEVRLREEQVSFNRGGELYHGYFNVTYTPLWENGKVRGLMESAEDVTDTVEARQHCQHVEERLRLAVEAAEMGSFSVHLPSMAFTGSARFRHFFGFSPDELITYTNCMNRIGDDFRGAVEVQIAHAIRTGRPVEMEFTVYGFPDQTERWVRGAGTLQRDRQGRPAYFTGIIMEVSEQHVHAFSAEH